jgi:hypothetical protein
MQHFILCRIAQTSQCFCACQDPSCKSSMSAIEELSPRLNTAEIVLYPGNLQTYGFTSSAYAMYQPKKSFVIDTQRFHPQSLDKPGSEPSHRECPNDKNLETQPKIAIPRIYNRQERCCVIDTCSVRLLILCTYATPMPSIKNDPRRPTTRPVTKKASSLLRSTNLPIPQLDLFSTPSSPRYPRPG